MGWNAHACQLLLPWSKRHIYIFDTAAERFGELARDAVQVLRHRTGQMIDFSDVLRRVGKNFSHNPGRVMGCDRRRLAASERQHQFVLCAYCVGGKTKKE